MLLIGSIGSSRSESDEPLHDKSNNFGLASSVQDSDKPVPTQGKLRPFIIAAYDSAQPRLIRLVGSESLLGAKPGFLSICQTAAYRVIRGLIASISTGAP